MNPIRSLARLAVDALEALIYLAPFDAAADKLWAETTSSSAHGSAGDDPSGGSIPNQDVEPPLGFQSIAEMVDRLDIFARRTRTPTTRKRRTTPVRGPRHSATQLRAVSGHFAERYRAGSTG
jgi:hypothetical protein